jgi:hypothetical protein
MNPLIASLVPTAIDHDQLFKQLLENFFVEFIQLFAPALTEYLDLTQLTFLPQQYFTDILDGATSSNIKTP